MLCAVSISTLGAHHPSLVPKPPLSIFDNRLVFDFLTPVGLFSDMMRQSTHSQLNDLGVKQVSGSREKFRKNPSLQFSSVPFLALG